MPFSIDKFWGAVERATAEFTDFRSECAREVAQLNLDPQSRVSESGFFESLRIAGVPHETVKGLMNAWGPQFHRFRDRARMADVRTPPLKLFKFCAESVGKRFDRPLDRALAGQWLEFAVRPTDRDELEGLLARMERYKIDPKWTAKLADTWEFLFAPGGHSDMDRSAPSTYYEIHDEVAAHVSIVHPSMEGHEDGPDGDELDAAMDLLSEHPALLIYGGRSDRAEGLDELLRRELAGDGATVVDMLGAPLSADDVSASFGKRDVASLVMTEGSLQEAGGDLRDYIRNEYFELNSPQKNPFKNPLRTLVIFAERKRGTEERAAERMAPALKGLGIERVVPVLAIQRGFNRSKSINMPNGNWKGYMDVLRAHAKDHIVTIGACQSPFRTFMLPLI